MRSLHRGTCSQPVTDSSAKISKKLFLFICASVSCGASSRTLKRGNVLRGKRSLLAIFVLCASILAGVGSSPAYAVSCQEHCEEYAKGFAETDAKRVYDYCMEKGLRNPEDCEDLRQGVYDSSYGYWYRVCMEACEQGLPLPEWPKPDEWPEIDPLAQVVSGGGSATWTTRVSLSSTPTTLRFCFGDGTCAADQAVPAGSGSTTFMYSKVFSGTGTYVQTAVILESSANSKSGTVRLGAVQPPAVGGGGGGGGGDPLPIPYVSPVRGFDPGYSDEPCGVEGGVKSGIQ